MIDKELVKFFSKFKDEDLEAAYILTMVIANFKKLSKTEEFRLLLLTSELCYRGLL